MAISRSASCHKQEEDPAKMLKSGQKLEWNPLVLLELSLDLLRSLIRVLSKLELSSWRVSSNSCSAGKGFEISLYLLWTKFSLILLDLFSFKESIWFWSTILASWLSCLTLLRVITFWVDSTGVFEFDVESFWSYSFFLLSVILYYLLLIINFL